MNHDVNNINFEMDCLPSERMSLHLLIVGVVDDINLILAKEKLQML